MGYRAGFGTRKDVLDRRGLAEDSACQLGWLQCRRTRHQSNHRIQYAKRHRAGFGTRKDVLDRRYRGQGEDSACQHGWLQCRRTRHQSNHRNTFAMGYRAGFAVVPLWDLSLGPVIRFAHGRLRLCLRGKGRKALLMASRSGGSDGVGRGHKALKIPHTIPRMLALNESFGPSVASFFA